MQSKAVGFFYNEQLSDGKRKRQRDVLGVGVVDVGKDVKNGLDRCRICIQSFVTKRLSD
jgi:hypothetical protein